MSFIAFYWITSFICFFRFLLNYFGSFNKNDESEFVQEESDQRIAFFPTLIFSSTHRLAYMMRSAVNLQVHYLLWLKKGSGLYYYFHTFLNIFSQHIHLPSTINKTEIKSVTFVYFMIEKHVKELCNYDLLCNQIGIIYSAWVLSTFMPVFVPNMWSNWQTLKNRYIFHCNFWTTRYTEVGHGAFCTTRWCEHNDSKLGVVVTSWWRLRVPKVWALYH